MRACAAKGELDLEKPLDILFGGKGKQREKMILSMDRFEPYFPIDVTPREIENKLISLLQRECEQNRRRSDHER